MSDAFSQTLQAAAESFFLLPGAQWVTYVPRTGAARRIRAVVRRGGPENMPGIADGSRPMFEVLVKNDDTEGIASDAIDTGGDKIQMGLRINNIPKTVRLTEILNHDAGMMLLAAQ